MQAAQTLARLAPVDHAVMAAYLAAVLGIGWALRRAQRTSADFLLAGRSLPPRVTGLAFLSAKLGALEVIAMGASGAKYGIAAAHFYWIGAVPAMLFLGLCMMPLYHGSRARSVPEYLRLRFDEKTRAFHAVAFAAMTVLSSGVALYAVGKLLERLLGWDLDTSVLASAGVVLAYVLLGGLTGAIYGGVLQLLVIVLGLAPLAFLGLRAAGGWSGLEIRLAQAALARGLPEGAYTHAWRGMGDASANPLGAEWLGLVIGLGVLLSFGSWGTDFRVVQRALAADSLSAARRTPLVAAVPTLLVPFLVIVPGMVAFAIGAGGTVPMGGVGQGLIPARIGANGAPMVDALGRTVLDYDLATPMLLVHVLPPGLLGLGLTALVAALMAGMAGNVTAFNTVWTYDLYQAHVRPGASDAHYLRVGRAATAGGIALSVAAAYAASAFDDVMRFLQLVFAFVHAPLLAMLALGMFWRRCTGHGAFWGLVAGTLGAAAHHGLTLARGSARGVGGGFLGAVYRLYPSELAQTLWTAITAFAACLAVTVAVSLVTRPRPDDELRGLVWSLTPRPVDDARGWWERPAPLALAAAVLLVALNVMFW